MIFSVYLNFGVGYLHLVDRGYPHLGNGVAVPHPSQWPMGEGHQDWMGVPLHWDWMGIPLSGLDGGTPPPSGDRRAERALATWRTVCSCYLILSGSLDTASSFMKTSLPETGNSQDDEEREREKITESRSD